MFLGVHFLVGVAISIAANALIGLVNKPRTEDPEGKLSPTGQGQGIPFIFNYYVLTGKIVYPNNKNDAFKVKGSGNDKTLRGYYLCVVSGAEGSGIYLRGLQLNGVAEVDYDIVNRDDLSQSEKDDVLERSNDFYEDHMQWREGTADQHPDPYWVSKRGFNHMNAFRNICTIGFRNLSLTRLNSNNLINPKVFCNTYKEYKIGDYLKKNWEWANLDQANLDTSEVDDLELGGYISLRNGNSYWSEIQEILSMRFCYPVELPDGRTSFRTLRRPFVTVDIPIEDIGVRVEGAGITPNYRRERIKAEKLPSQVALAFGVNGETAYSSIHPESTAQYIERVDTRLNVSLEEAEIIANKLLHQIWIRRERFYFTLDYEYKKQILPGDVVTLAGERTVQIAKVDTAANYILDVMAYNYDADSIGYGTSGSTVTPASSSGGAPPPPPSTSTSVTYQILDIPIAQANDGEAVLYCFANQRNASLYLSTDGGLNYNKALTFSDASTFGACNNTLGAVENLNLLEADLPLYDNINTLTVTLESGTLTSLNNSQMANQEQLLFIGKFEFGAWQGEIIAAQSVADLGNGQLQLSGFQRGLRGTEFFIHLHTPGESIFLINENTPKLLIDPGHLTKTLFFKSVTGEDLESVPSTSIDFVGQSYRPYPPTDITFSQDGDGNIIFNLNPRYRFAYLAGEPNDIYEIDILNVAGNVVRTISGTTPIYSAADIASDGLGSNLDFDAYKISTLVGRSGASYWRNQLSSGSSQTVSNTDGSSFQGFKTITGSYTITPEDKGYWLLLDANTSGDTLTLDNSLNADGFRCWVQNTGTELLLLSGNIIASEQFITPKQTLYLAEKSGGQFYGQLGTGTKFEQTITHTTASLAQGAQEDIDLTVLTKQIELISLTVDAPCRVRFYLDTTTRTNDAADVLTDATNDGILDLEFSPTNLTRTFLIPKLISSFSGTLLVRVLNNSGTDAAINIAISSLISGVQ